MCLRSRISLHDTVTALVSPRARKITRPHSFFRTNLRNQGVVERVRLVPKGRACGRRLPDVWRAHFLHSPSAVHWPPSHASPSLPIATQLQSPLARSLNFWHGGHHASGGSPLNERTERRGEEVSRQVHVTQSGKDRASPLRKAQKSRGRFVVFHRS